MANEFYTLNLETKEVGNLQTILMDEIKKDFKVVTGREKDAEIHFLNAVNFSEVVGIYCKVAQLKISVAEDLKKVSIACDLKDKTEKQAKDYELEG